MNVFVTYNGIGEVENAYGSINIVPTGAQYIVIPTAQWNAVQDKVLSVVDGVLVATDIPATPKDYDMAMEAHLESTRNSRGYTTREPSEYLNSNIPRWASDAIDWIAYRDQVMSTGLEVQNNYAQHEPVPTLEEFKAALPIIEWTYIEGNGNG